MKWVSYFIRSVFTFWAAQNEWTDSAYGTQSRHACLPLLGSKHFTAAALACSVWPTGANNAFAVCYFQRQINKPLVLVWGSRMVFVGVNQDKQQCVCVCSWSNMSHAQYLGSVMCFHIFLNNNGTEKLDFWIQTRNSSLAYTVSLCTLLPFFFAFYCFAMFFRILFSCFFG